MRWITLALMLHAKSLFACSGYPCDTLWFDEQGKLKEQFALQDFRFVLGSKQLITDSTLYGNDKMVIQKMYLKLDSLAKIIQADNGIFEIQYHYDCRSFQNSSTLIAQGRAQSICNYLVSQGVLTKNLIPKGFGSTSPRIFEDEETKKRLTCEFITRISETDKDLAEFYHKLNWRVVVKRIV